MLLWLHYSSLDIRKWNKFLLTRKFSNNDIIHEDQEYNNKSNKKIIFSERFFSIHHRYPIHVRSPNPCIWYPHRWIRMIRTTYLACHILVSKLFYLTPNWLRHLVGSSVFILGLPNFSTDGISSGEERIMNNNFFVLGWNSQVCSRGFIYYFSLLPSGPIQNSTHFDFSII